MCFEVIGSLLEEETDQELSSIRDEQRKGNFKATVVSKQPQRSVLTSDLKSRAQTAYATMFVGAV